MCILQSENVNDKNLSRCKQSEENERGFVAVRKEVMITKRKMVLHIKRDLMTYSMVFKNSYFKKICFVDF